jgi:hypothetical protein
MMIRFRISAIGLSCMSTCMTKTNKANLKLNKT